MLTARTSLAAASFAALLAGCGSHTLPTPAPGAAVSSDGVTPFGPERIVLTATQLDFYSTSPHAAKKVSASLAGFAGAFTTTDCADHGKTVARIKTVRDSDGKGTFDVIPRHDGTCTVEFSAHARRARLPIYVGPAGPITSNWSGAVSLTGIGGSFAAEITLAQPHFDGAFTESNTCTAVATFAAASNADGQATYDVDPKNYGNCSVTFAGGDHATLTLAVAVASPGASPSPSPMPSGSPSPGASPTPGTSPKPSASPSPTPMPSPLAYITVNGAPSIKVLAPGCSTDECFGSLGTFIDPRGIVLDGNGDFFVTNPVSATVQEMPAGCSTSSCLVNLGGGWNVPFAIAIDGSGNLFVTDSEDNTVSEVPPGCKSASCVTTLPGVYSVPQGVAVDGNDDVIVADSEDGYVKMVPKGCTSVTCVTPIGAGFQYPSAVAVDASGNVYVGDEWAHTVTVMPSSCASASCVTALGGGWGAPQGFALDNSGNIYVADYGTLSLLRMPTNCGSISCVTTIASGFGEPTDVVLPKSSALPLLRHHGGNIRPPKLRRGPG